MTAWTNIIVGDSSVLAAPVTTLGDMHAAPTTRIAGRDMINYLTIAGTP
jgi:hypothetical protein